MSGPRVLHVDDDREFLELTAEMLSTVADIETLPELDPTAVPERIGDATDIDLVLCDYEMPGWSGLDVLEAVRDEHPELPFVLYTGKGNESVAADVIALGATDYVRKGRGRDHFERLAERIRRAVADAEPDGSTALVDNAPFPVIAGWLAADGGLTVWDANPAFAERFGTDRDRLRGDRLPGFPEAVAVDAAPVSRPGLRTAAAAGEATTHDVRLSVDGDETPFQLAVVPGGDGRATGSDPFVWGVYVDVSGHVADRSRVTALHDAGLELAAAGTPAAVHEATVSAAETVLSFDRCVVYHEREGVLEPVAAAGVELSAVPPRPVDAGVAGRSYRDREAVRVADARRHPDATATDDGRSVVSVPVGRWGVLHFAADTTEQFTQFDRDLAYTLGAQAAAALDRVAREQATRAYQHRLADLHDATREFMEAGSVSTAARHVVDVAVDLLSPGACAIHRHDPEDGRLRVLSERSQTDGLAVVSRDPGEGAVGRAFARQEPVHVTAETDGGPVPTDTAVDGDEPTRVDTPDGVAAAVAYPLGDHGVLTLYDGDPGAFDDRDGHLGRVLAANAEAVLDRLVGERALRRREAQLERQNERLERFASLVSHDLRSPLEVVRGNVELARINDDPDRLDDALTALNRADELIEDMLTFARQGEHVTEVTPVGLARVAEAAWPAARTETDAETAGTFECETDCRVRADESRLRQLLENLFRNALEHNEGSVAVWVVATDDGFAVADDGAGLPSLSPTELFDPGTTTSEDGTGFGLSIVREIADAHGWTISVGESREGGARFEFVTDPTA